MTPKAAAVVTGASGGIGRATVMRLAELGHHVVAIGRNRAALEELADETAGSVSIEELDVVDEAAVIETVGRIGAIDVLVNNAGVASSAPFARTTLADWRHQLDVNATGSFLCTRAVLPGMLERDRGRVVFVASTAARAGYRYASAYAASKHAVLGLMRSVAAELAGSGVTTNAVCPAFVDTPMTSRSVARIVHTTDQDPQQARRALAESSPLGRLLNPSEVAAAIAFLVSNEAAAINGQALVIDGGGIHV